MVKKKSIKKPLQPNHKKTERARKERKLDKTLEDTFPASDPVTKY